MEYSEKKDVYSKNFSLGYLNTNFSDKIGLISLICYITYTKKQKEPGIDCYKVIRAITKDVSLPDDFIETLSIICEDYMYGTKEFPTFGCKTGDEIIKKIKSTLETWVPF